MSVYYDICEHLSVSSMDSSDTTAKTNAVKLMYQRLSRLGTLMLMDRATVHRMELTVDGKKMTFSGDCPNGAFKQLMGALNAGENIDISARYGYFWHLSDDEQETDMFSLEAFLEKLPDEELHDIFYSLWNKADSEGGEGVLCAVGEKGGKWYRGAVEFETVSAPIGGSWYADTDIAFSAEAVTPDELTNMQGICRELNGLTENEDPMSGIDVHEDSIDYYMNNVLLKTPKDFEKLTKLMAELCATSGDVSSVGEYVDDSGADARVMHIEYDESNTPMVKVAEIK